MALHPNFPTSPYAPLLPEQSWFSEPDAGKILYDSSNYTPDFIVRTNDAVIWIVETKGRAELDVPQKMARLKQWCADATAAEENGQRYDFVFVDQNGFEKHAPKTFAALAASFTEYKS